MSDEIGPDELESLFDDSWLDAGKATGFSTCQTPWEQGMSTDEVYQSVKDMMERAKEICPPPCLKYIVLDVRWNVMRQVFVEQLIAWSKGRCMPSIVNDFDLWWTAQMVKHGLIETVYGVNGDFLSDSGRLPKIWHAP